MFINKDSIVINGVNMGQYLVEARYSYSKLWDGSSGRNLAGSMISTLVGIFPKLILQFAPLTQTEFETIAPILDSARQTVSYYDPNKRAQITMTTYSGDYEVVNKGVLSDGAKIEGFSCSFISTTRRR